jgi:hypothetical protein
VVSYLQTLQWGAIASIAALIVGVANFVLLLVLVSRHSSEPRQPPRRYTPGERRECGHHQVAQLGSDGRWHHLDGRRCS